jgi:hypothetical protein
MRQWCIAAAIWSRGSRWTGAGHTAVTVGVAGLIPLLDFGDKKDSNCAALMDQAKSDAGIRQSDIAPQ